MKRMKLTPEMTAQFAKFGREGGMLRAARLSPTRRRAIAKKAAKASVIARQVKKG